MNKEMASHLKALMYLGTFVGRPAPRNSQIMAAAGVLVSASDFIFERLERNGFLTIERRSGSRRFVFADGSETGWGDNISGSRSASWKAPVRRKVPFYNDACAKRDIERYWRDQGKAVVAVISDAGVIRTYNADGTRLKFKMPVDTGDNVSRGTGASDA